ncbi:MAG: FtsX-like permease family protein [Planctomycetota bacterium]|nr:FtsX-like permease family protein [Planctomycetota bacterium]
MSVTERFREIGTMKCLGAQDGLVVELFLLESAFLGVFGALLGILLGVAVALLAAFMQYGAYGLGNFPVSGAVIVIGYSVLGGVLLSVVGAVYPAFAASRMRPVDALRVEE